MTQDYNWSLKAKKKTSSLSRFKKFFRTAAIAGLASAFALVGNAQSTIQLGSGTSTSSYVPNYYLYNYSYSQSIYTAAEMNAQGASTVASITKIWYKPTSSVATTNWKDWVIYMGNTTKEGFTSTTDWIDVSSMTQVFSGQLPANVTANTWLEITLTTPFSWDGTSNIVVAVDENTPTYGSSPNWAGYTLAPNAGNKVIYYYSDSNNPDPASPPTASSRTNVTAQIRFTGNLFPDCTGTPNAGTVPSTMAVCAGTSIVLTATGTSSPAVNLTGQWEESPAGAGTWTPITGATGATYTVASAPSVPTDYRYSMTCSNPGGGTAYSNILTATINPPSQCYCTPTYTSTSDYLSAISLTGNGNSNISYTASSQPTGGYLNKTSDTVEQSQSLAVNLSTTYVGGSNTVKAWVDYNNDGIFDDATEKVYDNYASGTSQSGNFTIPVSTPIGDYRIRVRSRYSTTAFTACDQQSWGSAVDFTLRVVAAPSCLPPTTLAANNITSVSADLSWTANNTGNSFDIEYGPQGFTQGSGTIVADIANPYTLQGLTPTTTYSYFVKQNCSPTSSSLWAGPFTFTTACATFAAPFLEEFSNGALPNCWTNTSDGTGTNALWRFGSGAGYGTTNNGKAAGTYAWVDASSPYANIHNVTLTSPMIDISTLTTPYLEFEWFKNNNDPSAANYDQNKLTVEVNDGSGWTTVFSDTSNAPVWRNVANIINTTANTIQVRFVVDKDLYGNGYFYDDILLDNVSISEAPLSCSGTPSAGTVTASVDTICGGISFDLNGTAINALGITYQWQSQPLNGSWSDIAGATTPNYTLQNGQMEASNYRLIVTCNGTNSDTSNVVTVNQYPGIDCYCIPTYTSGCFDDDVISNVSLNGVSVNLNNSTGCSTGAYGDYTNLPAADLLPGGNYIISVGTAYLWPEDEDVRIWIDYNENGVFEASEEIGNTMGNGLGANGSSDFYFTVPTNVTPGNYRMRVRLVYSGGSTIDPCNTAIYGETEDYMVEILTPCTPPVVNLGADTAVCEGTTVTLDAGNAGLTYLWNDGSTNQTLAVTAGGTYSVTVTDGSCSTSDTIVVTVDTMPLVDLGGDQAICQGDTVTLDAGNAGLTFAWNDGSTNQTLEVSDAGSYSVEVTNGACVATDTVEITIDPLPSADSISVANLADCGFEFALVGANDVTSYAWDFGDNSVVDTSASPSHNYTSNGNYTVTVTVENNCGSETFTTTVECTGLGINNIDLNNSVLKLYPNPTADFVTIENLSQFNMETITVMNVLGQVVYQDAAQASFKHTMNVSHFSTGLYTVRIQTNGGVVIRKFEVLK